mmetsp:Transcript_100502/g.322507  ORF Transcript_100502/g.322507 Transcript_100502/m.322507 type:complete len:235 (+) Transcript_100502:94-798(+)
MRPGAAAGRTERECFFGMPSSMAASPATPPAPLPRRLSESSNASSLTSLMSPLKAGAAGRRRNAGAMYAAGSGVESYTTSFFFGSGVLGASASASQSEGASASASASTSKTASTTDGAGSAAGSSWSGCMGQCSEMSMRSSGTLPSGDRHPASIGPFKCRQTTSSGNVVGATRASNDAAQGAGAPSSETTGEGGWGRAEETGCLTSVQPVRGSSLTGFVSILTSCEPLALHCGT